MKTEESSQSAELDSDHGDIDPSLGTGLGGFVIPHQSPLAHQPAESAFHHPAVRQHFEALGVVGTFDDLNLQFGPESLDPVGKRLPGVAAIHPQNTQPGEPAQHPAEQQLGTVTFGGVGRGHGHAQDQSQGVHQQVPLAALDALGGIIPHLAAVTGGFDALTVQNRGRWPAALAVGAAHQDAQGVMDNDPAMIGNPLPEDMINRFPMRKIGGQITPGTPALDQVQDGLEDAAAIGGRTAQFGGLGQQGLEIGPLGVGQVGVVSGFFHRPTGATANDSRKSKQADQVFCAFIWPSDSAKTPPISFFRRTLTPQFGICTNIIHHRDENILNPNPAQRFNECRIR